jgi:16S rRNA processing protein RimM
MPDRLILMATIGRAHGVRGQVRVSAFAADPRALESYPLQDQRGRAFSLRWIAEGVAAVTVLEAGAKRRIDSRTEAETLTNLQLFTPRTALPAAAEEEFYLTDLIGLAAEAEDGSPLGRIASVHDYGAGVSLEIAGAGGAALLIPFTREAVPVVDIEAGRVVIRRPAEIIVEATSEASLEEAGQP